LIYLKKDLQNLLTFDCDVIQGGVLEHTYNIYMKRDLPQRPTKEMDISEKDLQTLLTFDYNVCQGGVLKHTFHVYMKRDLPKRPAKEIDTSGKGPTNET